MRFALIGAIALLILSGYAVAQQRQLQQPRNQPTQQQTAPDNRGTDQVPFVVKELPRERADEERKEAREKSELDRKLTGYTADLATYTQWLFGATLLLALLTGGLAGSAFWQIRDSRAAIKAARDSAKLPPTSRNPAPNMPGMRSGQSRLARKLPSGSCAPMYWSIRPG
jgi:hypothetical protein